MANKDILNHAESKFAKAKEAANTMQASEVEVRDAKTARLKAERLARDAKDEAAAGPEGRAIRVQGNDR